MLVVNHGIPQDGRVAVLTIIAEPRHPAKKGGARLR